MRCPAITKKIIAQVESVAADEGWVVDADMGRGGKLELTFSKPSPLGRDFSFTIDFELPVKFLSEVADDVYAYWLSFDADYETMLWLDEDGHGKNGAPYRMGEVLSDSEAIEEMIGELSRVLYDACK